MTKTEQQIAEDFPADFREKLVSIIRESHDVSYSHYAPEMGHDLMVYGLMVYKTKTHLLAQLEDKEKNIQLKHQRPSFCLQVGRYRLSTYCAGRSASSDIEVSFPLNRTRAAIITTRNKNQLELFPEFEDTGDDSMCREIVLAEIGNPEEGALKVFLAIPVDKDKDGRITRWGTTFPLWESDQFAQNAADATSTFYIPAEDIQPLTLTLRDDPGHEEPKKAEGAK